MVLGYSWTAITCFIKYNKFISLKCNTWFFIRYKLDKVVYLFGRRYTKTDGIISISNDILSPFDAPSIDGDIDINSTVPQIQLLVFTKIQLLWRETLEKFK